MSQIQLNFFTDNEEITSICKQYWDLDEDYKFKQSVANIAKTFGLKSNQTSRLIAEYCNAFSPKYVCDICETPYIFANRSDYQNWQRSQAISWICPSCREAQRERKLKEQKAIEEQKRIVVREEFSLDKRHRAIDIQLLPLDSAIYLLALVRLGASEDLSYIRPFASTSQPLAPSQDYGYEIIKQLFRENLIFVHPDSDPNAFIFEGNTIPRFYTGHVMWALPTDPILGDPKELIANLEAIFREMNWPDHWHVEWPDIWNKIALYECLEYLNVCMEDHGLTFSPGEKTILVFKNVLANFSVSQAYNMIWRAAKDAAAFYLRENVPKKHAANTVVGSIQKYAERAKAQGWDVKKYGRDRRCPQSLISEVLFNTVLQIGDDGFNEPPASQS